MRHCPLALAAVAFLPRLALGQSTDDTFFHAQYEHALIDSELPQWVDWRIYRVQAYRDFGGGALGLEVARTERFALEDESVTLDAYLDLWDGAYANLRARATRDADVLPDRDARVELFQTFGGAWEASLAVWRMGFSGPDVGVFGAGLARYHGDWYLRGRASLSRTGGESAGSVALSARRFLGGPRQWVELSAGVGEEGVVVDAGPIVDLRSTRFLQAVVQRSLWGSLGVWLLGAHESFEGGPARVSVGVGLSARMGGGPR